MKPPPLTYCAPRRLEDVLAALAAVDGAKVLAGGQSLLPILNMRLAAPACLVDINHVAALDHIHVDGDAVVVGATARHAGVEGDPRVAAALPLLGQALRHVAHPVIRNRGTVCGSLAHADPAAELPAVLALTGGSVTAASAAGTREVPASELFVGPLESSLRPEELITAARFPTFPPGTGTAFVEVARRHGDYALAGVAAAVRRHPGAPASARLAFVSLAPTPLVLDVPAELAAAGDWAAAGEQAAAACEPEEDIHATADYRRHLARVLTVRALTAAAAGADGAAA